MPTTIAIIPIDLQRSALGLPSRLADSLGGQTVLQRTLQRAAKIPGIGAITLTHPVGQDPAPLLDEAAIGFPVRTLAYGHTDPCRAMRVAARKWALSSWRGGLGGMTCYDELLPAQAWLDAMLDAGAESAVILGGDWPLVDPPITGDVLALHRQYPEQLKLTFCQAPPGIAGIAMGLGMVEQLAENADATIGKLLSYTPTRPQPDPIGRDLCVQIPHQVRAAARRFVYDTPRSAAMIDALVDSLIQEDRQGWLDADALTIVDAMHRASDTNTGDAPAAIASPSTRPRLPQQITIELTTRRELNGPLMPQHYASFERGDMALSLAKHLIDQAAGEGDIAITFGGVGDPLLHPHWREIVDHATHAGVFATAIETDLIVDEEARASLLAMPIDVLSVRLNADKAATYERTMGADEESGVFKAVIANLEWLLNERHRRGQLIDGATAANAHGAPGMPWLVPRLIKHAATLGDMETFFDRWTHYAGHAVIEPMFTGNGLVPPVDDAGGFPMPRKMPCRQAGGIRGAGGRMLVHSDGRIPHCDEDWLGRSVAGDANTTALAELWARLQPGTADANACLCEGCRRWYGVEVEDTASTAV